MGEIEPEVLLESYAAGGDSASYAFMGLCGQVEAGRPEEVRAALAAVELAVERGLHAAGFVCYEAAAGLDMALETQESGEWPLLWFGLFEERREVVAGQMSAQRGYSIGDWQPSISRQVYDRDLRVIREYIAAGDTYQVNYSFRLQAEFEGDDRAFYADLCQAQGSAYCAYVNLGRFRLLSAAPELFFSLRDGVLQTRPMKGTQERGRWWAEDEELAQELHHSPKNRAENAMIVDLLRNDMGRISLPGSVLVDDMWAVERYETVWQMTSGVGSTIQPDTGLVELFAALFPCGSVTGAPKVRTMQIIRELEMGPRGPYTGCIGYVSPGMEACFNVAIRTVCLDLEIGAAEFGVGGGITWDSSLEGEYGECLVKARVLTSRRPAFDLLETLRYDPNEGFFLLQRHLQRLGETARYFGFCCDLSAVESYLQEVVAGLEGVHRVRLTLGRQGEIAVQCTLLPEEAMALSWQASIAKQPVDSSDPFLFNKTTHRKVYEDQLAQHVASDEVILHNERGEVTECCYGNLVAVFDGEQYTPPRQCGLLGGTFRAELLERGEIKERIILLGDLPQATDLYLINSVRKWVQLTLV